MIRSLIAFLALTLMNCGQQHRLMEPSDYRQSQEPLLTLKPANGEDPGRWWELFNDPDLNKTLLKGLRESHQIKIHLAKIDQKKMVLGKLDANYAPTLSVGSSILKQQSVSESTGTPISYQSDLASLSLDLSYSLDPFGGKDAAHSAAELDLVASIEDLKQEISEFTNGFVKNWILSKELVSQIQLNRLTILADEENLNFVSKRYELGLASPTDIFQAQRQLIATKTQLPGLQLRQVINRHALYQLLGFIPDLETSFVPMQILERIEIDELIPSSALIKKRPDLRATLARIKIADHQIGVAVAAQFPQLSFSASLGTQSDGMTNLFNADYSVWNLLGNITYPIIDGKSRKMEVLRTEAVLQERLLDYQALLFKIVNGINENLAKVKLQDEKIGLIKKQIEIIEQTLKITTDNYTRGLGDWSQVTVVLNQQQQAKSSLLTAQREFMDSKIDLLIAMGGQWIDDFIQKEPNISKEN
ncbi:MAG: TolC family protein [Proteobacteria bacterium]|nr:TolC family protein [Pseudomonadota bacterium]